MVDEQQQRDPVRVPVSELEAGMMLTDSRWGDGYIAKELKDKLRTMIKKKIRKGTIITTAQGDFELPRDMEVLAEEELWSLLNYYTRDMRLGNLSRDEVDYCQHFIDLAGDLLHDSKKRVFVIALSRAATMLELSQSKGGFLRKRLGTFTKEEFRRGDFDKPSILFGGGKKKDGGGF